MTPEPGRRGALVAFAARGAVFATAAGALVAVPALLQRDPSRGDRAAVAAMTRGGCRYDTSADAGRTHVERPSYTVEPPAGGPHLPRPAAPGSYPDPPPDGELVHAMEHGAVVVWVRDGLAPFAPLAARYPDDVVLVPRPGLPVPLAATSWHRRLLCAAPDTAAVERFVGQFRGRGPERLRRVHHGVSAPGPEGGP